MKLSICFVFMIAALTTITCGQPIITNQPASQSVSVGARVTFQVAAGGVAPLHFQWHFNSTEVLNATSRSLVLTNAQLANAGDYLVVVTNSSGSITSQLAHLEVDPAFTKITTGPVVTNGGYGFGCAWGDYDGDGFVDLFVCNWNGGTFDFLYHNKGNGTFERIMTGPEVTVDGSDTVGAAWADYDNDGKLDLFVARLIDDGTGYGFNTVYHNEGNGKFTKLTKGPFATQRSRTHSGIWADFDNDGFVDLMVANFGFDAVTEALPNFLYHNNGDGTFTGTPYGPAGKGGSWDIAAGDYNNDGWIDVFLPQGGTIDREGALLYMNNRDGTLSLQTNSVMASLNVFGNSCAWGDYDNDGFLDLFMTRLYDGNNLLYHNNGNGTFTLITNVAPTLDGGNSTSCTWADYDNDGWLDLFVANVGMFDPKTLISTGIGTNCLYHNNGDGTFTKVLSGSLVNDSAYSIGAAWADYNNDGFPDLFVSNGWITTSENNFLYLNNTNGNNWINLKLVGTVSNRSAIGAKVRVKATIGGKTFWQMREISGGSGHGSQNDMRANFGLGDATNVDLVRIEWPSGILQTMTNVPAKQFLTVVEHQSPGVCTAPQFTHVSRTVGGATDLSVTGDTGFRYLFEASTNLVNWSWLGTRTNLSGTFQFTDGQTTNFSKRFYRVSAP